ncbi:phakinin [Trichomycterus rosablanca]|uniref:phakinin n=1 Tax=Trichomycterus rosablanca TaxID=2290929 RepID=UPI002F352E92
MPLPRRRSSILGQPASERPGSARRVSVGSATSPRGVFVGMIPSTDTSCLGARVSRRALGISSVFLQGLRSTSTPVLPQHTCRGHQLGPESLNSCLLQYHDKVHALEQLNQQLEEQIRNWLERKASTAETWDSLRHQWEDVYRRVSEAILDNARLMLQTENIQANAEDLKDRFENEQPFRKAVEEEINSLYKVIDEANLTKIDLENQIETMKVELTDLDRNHEEDVRLLYNQLAGSENDKPDAPIETSLDHILTYIRSHWEKVIEKTRAETDTYLESKQMDNVNKERSQEEAELENLKTDCKDANARIQSLQAKIESIRALKRGLENSLNDAKHWHDIELQNLGSVIGKLDAELNDVNGDIEQQQHDYQTLLTNKKRMEMEIGIYHGIMDGEESRYHPQMSKADTATAEEGPAPQASMPEQQSSTQTDGTSTSTDNQVFKEKEKKKTK